MVTKKIMVREHSREYSLFRIYTMQMIMEKILEPMLGEGINEVCFVYKGGLVKAYYQPESLKLFFQKVAEFSRNTQKIIEKINEFNKLFEKLAPYFRQEKDLKNIQEFKKIYDLYVAYGTIWAMIFIIPNIPTVDQKIKELALRAREKTQEYNEAIEDILKNFISKKFSKYKEKVKFILPEEIWRGELEDDILLDKIKERERGFLFYKGEFYAGDIDKYLEDLGIILEEGEVISKDIKEINGQIAHKGKVRGKVKIVLLKNDLGKVEDGDIFVTVMTIPKYLPAMMRAAAFVTDEGGITSHAAIIAREFKKPCIIGTKIATQILKDGDLVEVDADEGVVKILK